MDKSLARIYEAHVDFMLERYRKDRVPQLIENWIDSLWEELADVPVHEWLTKEKLAAHFKRYTVDFPLSGGITEIIGECSKKFLSFDIHKETMLKDFFSRELWNYLVDKIAEMDYLKKRIIQILLRSRLVKHIIADVLYFGIIECLPQFNTVVSHISRFVFAFDEELKQKIDTLMENDSVLEENLYIFVEEHIDQFAEGFEARIDQFVTDERLKDYGDELWEDIFHTPLTEYFQVISNDDIEDFIIFGYEFWKHFRKTRFFQEVYEEIIQIIIDRYHSYLVPEMLDDLGFSRDVLVAEIKELVAPHVQMLLVSGRLEKMIRRDLKAFYHSEAARAAFTPPAD